MNRSSDSHLLKGGKLLCLLLLVSPLISQAQSLPSIPDLVIQTQDLRLENSNEGGYLLYVRAKPDLKSILITESTEPDSHKIATYTMRTKTASPTNNDRKRLLDGKVLDRPDLYFLVTSTPVPDTLFGQAFRLFIPYVVEYGFPEGRHGERQIINGAFLSIRAFQRPWADYGGAYRDNPFKLKLTQAAPQSSNGEIFNRETVAAFRKLASATQVESIRTVPELIPRLKTILAKIDDVDLDLVLCLDATGSMEPYRPYVHTELVPLLKEFLAGHRSARFAFVQYRDIFEEFVYRVTPFTTDFGVFQAALNRYRPLGGGDIPEAIDEALYGAIGELQWQAAKRLIILVGDAPPHPLPRSMISRMMLEKAIRNNRVEIIPIVLPNGQSAAEKP